MRQKIQAGLPVVIAFFLIVFIEAGLRLAKYGYSPEFFIEQVVEGRESIEYYRKAGQNKQYEQLIARINTMEHE